MEGWYWNMVWGGQIYIYIHVCAALHPPECDHRGNGKYGLAVLCQLQFQFSHSCVDSGGGQGFSYDWAIYLTTAHGKIAPGSAGISILSGECN